MDIKYNLLNTERPQYQQDKVLWEEMLAHQENDVLFLRKLLIPKRSWESNEEYEDRITAFTYTPLMSSFLSNMAANMTGSPFVVSTKSQVVDYLLENFDSKGTGITEYLSEIYTTLLFFGRCYTVIDFRDNLPYLVPIHPLQVIDEGEGWYRVKQITTRRDAFGNSSTFVTFMVFTEAETLVFSAPCIIKHGDITHLVKDGKAIPIDKATVPLVAQDSHGLKSSMVAHIFKKEYFLGKLLVEKQNQYSRIETAWTLSGMVAGQVIRMFTPVQRDANDPRRLDMPNYDDVKLSSQRVLVGDNFQFAESTGTAIQNLTSQLEKIEQQMREITSQKMTGEPNAAVSGVSKGIDAEELNTTMRSHGTTMRQYLETVLNRVSLLSGFPEDVSVSGFNDFELAQREKLLETSIKVGGFAPYLPVTVQKLWWLKVSKALVGTVSTELLDEIEVEIEDIFNGIQEDESVESE